jgi:hypothetical protein
MMAGSSERKTTTAMTTWMRFLAKNGPKRFAVFGKLVLQAREDARRGLRNTGRPEVDR